MTDLKEQLKQELAEGKEIKITSADVAAGRVVSNVSDTPATPAVASGPVEVPASQKPGIDPLIQGSAVGDTGKNMAGTMEAVSDKEKQAVDLTGARLMKATVVIDPGTKASFIDSMITGKRFKLPFSVFGGKVTGVLRSRSQAESLAIIARINREISDKTVNNGLEYATRLRNMLLATQVDSLGSDSFVELKAPLMTTVEGPDKVMPPGWLPQVQVWEAKGEGLASALYQELIVFEQKYWTMVDNAGDQNFWNPAEST